jgi:hypothetical protein
VVWVTPTALPRRLQLLHHPCLQICGETVKLRLEAQKMGVKTGSTTAVVSNLRTTSRQAGHKPQQREHVISTVSIVSLHPEKWSGKHENALESSQSQPTKSYVQTPKRARSRGLEKMSLTKTLPPEIGIIARQDAFDDLRTTSKDLIGMWLSHPWSEKLLLSL